MSAPRRLVDDPAADQALQRVLRDGSAARPLDDLTRRRLGAKLSRAAALPAAAAGWLFVKSATAALGAVGIAASVATVTGVIDWPSAAPVPKAQPAPPARPRAERALPAPPPAALEVPAPQPELGPAGASSVAPAPAAAASSLAVESTLLEQARREVRRAPAVALQITSEHAQRFPRGQLASERTLIQVDALHRLGRDDEARARAEGLLRGASGELYRERVKSLLGESGAR